MVFLHCRSSALEFSQFNLNPLLSRHETIKLEILSEF